MTKLLKTLAVLASVCLLTVGCNNSKYDYVTVEDDPMGVQMYTLKNGLRVYMSVNKEEPRIQTAIAVRAGSKNEPEESTGLAHYLEHVMFKGTQQFGTLDYAKEKPMLDEIERLYEVYRKTTDAEERKAIYHQIDSVSYEASKLAIPNEYDKLMATIGSDGTNAYTSYDVTCYIEDIPSNQIDNWAMIQADRFKNMVIRGFHTELEAVYEEYNGGLTEDWDKLHDTIATVLYPSHSYKRGIIGKQEHLKSPSISNIMKFFNTYYVPNNMAICVSGDFNPDEMIDAIEKYFGDMKPNENLPKFEYKKDPELKSVVKKTVLSPQEEYVTLAWRFDGAASLQQDTLEIIDNLLSNGTAGLIDIDLNLKHAVLEAGSIKDDATDYTTLQLRAYPMPGQSLDELKNILLKEVAKLRKGQFSKELVEAVVNNCKLDRQKKLESNSKRVNSMVDAFVNGCEWSDVVSLTSRQEKITKEALVKFANKYLRNDNFVAIYKRKGNDPDIKPVDKPSITPIVMNRDVMSSFVKEVSESKVAPIEPVFLDYNKDIAKAETDGELPVVYVENKVNELFLLNYVFDMGSYADPALGLAASYLAYLGTDSLSAEEVSQAFYRLGCSYDISVGNRKTYIEISGLDENMPQAMALFEHLITRARPDKDAWDQFVGATIQSRTMRMSDFQSYYSQLRTYLMYGQDYISSQVLSNERLLSCAPDSILAKLKNLNGVKHEIAYYGPRSMKDAVAAFNEYHHTGSLSAPLKNKEWQTVQPKESKVFFVPFYETMNFDICQYACSGEKYDVNVLPTASLYQEYFSGSMNSIVFQDMREKKALVYGASAKYRTPSHKDDYSTFTTYAESQSDKLSDVVTTFGDIINNLPQVEASFSFAKEALVARLRTQRTTGSGIIWSYYQARNLGVDYDPSSVIYNKVQDLTLKDVVAFQKKHIKDKPSYYGISGNKAALDFSVLEKLGPVTELTPEAVFGY